MTMCKPERTSVKGLRIGIPKQYFNVEGLMQT